MTLPKHFRAYANNGREFTEWSGFTYTPPRDANIVQWTGIDDLYEGDIVKVEIGSPDGVKEITCIVVFHQCAFMFKDMWQKDRYLWIPERKYKKVGNKYAVK